MIIGIKDAVFHEQEPMSNSVNPKKPMNLVNAAKGESSANMVLMMTQLLMMLELKEVSSKGSKPLPHSYRDLVESVMYLEIYEW